MGELRMSAKERIRLEAVGRVKRGELTLACEKLAADHDLMLSPNTLTALLKERALWERRRRRGRHRKRRERRSCFGSMIQMDGSHHDWFEGRAATCVLMVMIDDATSR